MNIYIYGQLQFVSTQGNISLLPPISIWFIISIKYAHHICWYSFLSSTLYKWLYLMDVTYYLNSLCTLNGRRRDEIKLSFIVSPEWANNTFVNKIKIWETLCYEYKFKFEIMAAWMNSRIREIQFITELITSKTTSILSH